MDHGNRRRCRRSHRSGGFPLCRGLGPSPILMPIRLVSPCAGSYGYIPLGRPFGLCIPQVNSKQFTRLATTVLRRQGLYAYSGDKLLTRLSKLVMLCTLAMPNRCWSRLRKLIFQIRRSLIYAIYGLKLPGE